MHVDAGWNSELAVENIQNIVTSLNLDLHTLVSDWPEVRDIQRAYVLSGIANLDVAQDHAFNAALNREARRYGIKHVLTGGNMQTESILPAAWGYDAGDSTSLKAIHKRYGTISLKQYPMMSPIRRYVLNPYVYRLKVHRPLEYIDYNKSEAKNF